MSDLSQTARLVSPALTGAVPGAVTGAVPDAVPSAMTSAARVVRSPRGTELSCANWQIEAAYRMLQNNLDPEVAENPAELIVYGGIGKAARNWACFDAMLEALKTLKPDETLMVQSGKPVGVFRTHEGAPRVLIANSNLVPKWATWEHFNKLDQAGLMILDFFDAAHL